MHHLKLIRTLDDGQRTIGKLIGLGRLFYTIERPWLNNEMGVSCIPTGTYSVRWRHAPWSKWPFAYEVLNVPGRSGILIHSANLASQLKGCIALGLFVGQINGERGVLSSRLAMIEFEKLLARAPFDLEIRNDY